MLSGESWRGEAVGEENRLKVRFHRAPCDLWDSLIFTVTLKLSIACAICWREIGFRMR
jgi:hypothetical protein